MFIDGLILVRGFGFLTFWLRPLCGLRVCLLSLCLSLLCPSAWLGPPASRVGCKSCRVLQASPEGPCALLRLQACPFSHPRLWFAALAAAQPAALLQPRGTVSRFVVNFILSRSGPALRPSPPPFLLRLLTCPCTLCVATCIGRLEAIFLIFLSSLTLSDDPPSIHSFIRLPRFPLLDALAIFDSSIHFRRRNLSCPLSSTRSFLPQATASFFAFTPPSLFYRFSTLVLPLSICTSSRSRSKRGLYCHCNLTRSTSTIAQHNDPIRLLPYLVVDRLNPAFSDPSVESSKVQSPCLS